MKLESEKQLSQTRSIGDTHPATCEEQGEPWRRPKVGSKIANNITQLTLDRDGVEKWKRGNKIIRESNFTMSFSFEREEAQKTLNKIHTSALPSPTSPPKKTMEIEKLKTINFFALV